MTSNITLLVFSSNNTAPLAFKAGKSAVYKARAGERYRLMRSEESEASPMPAVVVRRVGQDLRLDDADNHQVVLENYFAVCKDSTCELTLGHAGSDALEFTDASAPLALLGDGSALLYVQGGQEALAAIVSGNSSLRLAMAEPAGQAGLMTAQSGVNAQDSFAQWVPARLRQMLSGAGQAEASEDSNPYLLGWLSAAGGFALLGLGAGGSGSGTAATDLTAPAVPQTPLVITDDVEKTTGVLDLQQAITNDATPQFSGSNAEAGATVTLMDGAAVLGKTVVAANGSWSFTPSTPMAEGLHSISYTLSDAAGNKSLASTPVAFRVDTQTPGTLGVGLDPSDSGDVSQGVVLRVTLDNKAAAGDSIETRLMRDDVEVQVMLQTLSSTDIQQGHVLQRVDAASVAINGRFSTSTRLFDAAGNESQVFKKLDTFTILDGLVHDDYMANAFVFVDSNNSGQFDGGISWYFASNCHKS